MIKLKKNSNKIKAISEICHFEDAKNYYKPYNEAAIQQYNQYYTREKIQLKSVERALNPNRKKNKAYDKMVSELLTNLKQLFKEDVGIVIDDTLSFNIKKSIYNTTIPYNNDILKANKGYLFENDINEYISNKFSMVDSDGKYPKYQILGGNLKESYKDIDPKLFKWGSKGNKHTGYIMEKFGNKPDGLFILEDGSLIIIYSQISLWNRDIHKLKSFIHSSIFDEYLFEGKRIMPLFVIAEPFTFNPNGGYECRAMIEGYLNKNIVYKDMLIDSMIDILNTENLYKVNIS